MKKLTKLDLERRTVVEDLDRLDRWGTLRLDELVRRYGADASLDIEVDGYDAYVDVRIQRIRKETDEEYEARLEATRQLYAADAERQRTVKAAQKERDRKEYERLKKLFEK